MVLVLDIEALTLNGTLMPEHLLLYLTRKGNDTDLAKEVPLVLDFTMVEDDEEVEMFLIEYSESIHHKWKSNVEHSYFERMSKKRSISLDFMEANNFFASDTDIVLLIVPDMKVEHWQEYVTFGYDNWLSEMGGLFSLMTTGYLWIS